MTTSWQALDQRYCWHPFTQAQTAAPPLTIVRGEGAYLFDEAGRAYLDAISSWWVNLHGHAHPVIADAIAAQARSLEQVMFAGITHPPAIALAEQLATRLPAPLQYTFFTDNGSTAVEVALKIAVQLWRNRGQRRTRFLALEGGYHGDTFGAMAAGKSSGFYAPFSDWLFGVDFLPYPATWNGHDPSADEARSIAALDAYLDRHGNDTVAFILEPLVQGAAGMRIARAAWLQAIVARVQARGIPVIFDEVMTGFGRTGTLFAAEQVGVTPDLICLSKGLTGGFLPMGATVVQPHLYEAFLDADVGKALLHGHSYTANPLGCAAALASLRVFDTEQTLQRIDSIATTLRRLLAELAEHPAIERPRQLGSIVAFDLRVDDGGYGAASGQALRERLQDVGMLLRPLGRTVYCLPPYCVSDAALIDLFGALRQALDATPKPTSRQQPSDYF